MSDICRFFDVRTRKGFTGSVGKQQGATMIMMNMQPVKCTKEAIQETGRDLQVINFCVVAVHAEGMVRAPFKYNEQRKSGVARVQTKPLSSMSSDGGMQFWTYQRKGQDKGERFDDDTWFLYAGTTIKIFIREEDVTKGIFGGATEIPEFSLCEVQLVPKSSDPCREGWGLNVRAINCAQLSLYSYFELNHKFPTSVDDAKIRAIATSDAQQQMRRQVEGDSSLFLQYPVCIEAYTELVSATESENNGGDFVRLWNCIPGNPACVDINVPTLLRMTNCVNVDNALRILEISACTGNLALYCFSNEYRGRRAGLSSFTGTPLINTDGLLSCVTSTAVLENDLGNGDQYKFFVKTVDCFSGAAEGLFMTVGGEEQSSSGNCGLLPSHDLILCERIDQCGQGVGVSFVLSSGTVLWRGYVNTSPVQMLCAGGATLLPQRRKWDSL